MERLISRALRLGVIVSSLFLIGGFIVALLHPEVLSHPSVHPSAEHFLSLFRFDGAFFTRLLDPFLLFYLGIFSLLLTPILRVVIAIVSFALQRDASFMFISIAVFLIILLSLYLSFWRS